jgi:phage gp36-like protein
MAVTPYCTLDDLSDRLSAEGVNLRLDDVPPTASGNVLRRTANKINQFLLRQYTAANLATSDIVNELAISIGVYYLCTRRGNPAPESVIAAYEEALDDLASIRRGQTDIGDIARRRQSAPVMDNVRIRLRPNPHAVVSTSRSTTTGGTPSGYTQHNDLIEPESTLTDPTGA